MTNGSVECRSHNRKRKKKKRKNNGKFSQNDECIDMRAVTPGKECWEHRFIVDIIPDYFIIIFFFSQTVRL